MILSHDFPEDLYSFQKEAKLISFELSDKLRKIELAQKKTISKYLTKHCINVSTIVARLFIISKSTGIIEAIYSGLNGEDSLIESAFNYRNEKSFQKEDDIYYLWLLSDKSR